MTDYAYAARIIEHFENYISVAKWDVNAWRVGFGSDTEGPEQHKVLKGTTTTRERALENLEKRMVQFEREIMRQIGAVAWNKLPTHIQGPLLSVAYNYGDLPEGVAKAAVVGNPRAIAIAITKLEHDNGGINERRRIAEAAIVATTHGG